jgi:hypothetical protein
MATYTIIPRSGGDGYNIRVVGADGVRQKMLGLKTKPPLRSGSRMTRRSAIGQGCSEVTQSGSGPSDLWWLIFPTRKAESTLGIRSPSCYAPRTRCERHSPDGEVGSLTLGIREIHQSVAGARGVRNDVAVCASFGGGCGDMGLGCPGVSWVGGCAGPGVAGEPMGDALTASS